jgi:hypothetical protein
MGVNFGRKDNKRGVTGSMDLGFIWGILRDSFHPIAIGLRMMER